MKAQFKQLTPKAFEELITEAGLPRFRSDQVLQWVYGKNVASFDEMTNLPKSMREQLDSLVPLTYPTIVDKQVSEDGSRKYLVQYEDGALVETVGIPNADGRLSVCVSSQSGCAMNCAFCATGRNGLNRSLYPGEIVDQVQVVQDDFDQRVTNVVVMGQGEPFANYDNTLAALRIINHPKYLNIGARHITISTCGLISGIEKLSQEPEQFTLAVSLHSAIQETRDSIMPGVSKQPLVDLHDALSGYNGKTGRRFSFEFALMDGINTHLRELEALYQFCKNLLCHVNLIPLNEIDGSPFKPVSRKVLLSWQEALEAQGIACSIRDSRGSDISGACGQLASKHQ
ncbi:MAG: 23S rRNA (adenine(2503)-C(2))-methyltransferase RlmN [Eggerthellaceae bacterium]|nr:23S rRNA (adenine(2503)-C(2))-methyltransferase RlmN [Eggerthellaceae bacterium]